MYFFAGVGRGSQDASILLTNALMSCMREQLGDASDRSKPCIVVVIDDVALLEGVVGVVGTLRMIELG